jgi:hypothetical protein
VAQVSWLVMGGRSGRPIVVGPAADDATDAVTRVDGALDGFAGPVPRWFEVTEKIGYGWFAIWMAVGLVVALVASPAALQWRIASGLMIGLIVAPISIALFRLVARAQSRAQGAPTTERALRDAAGRARPTTPDTVRQVEVVLATSPHAEHRVHDLVWRAAAPDPAARKELEGLWEKADPEAAALQKRQMAQLQAEIDDLRSEGTA